MPVEIRELIIRAEITDKEEGQESSDNRESSKQDVDIEAIVSACVEQVMEIIKEKSER